MMIVIFIFGCPLPELNLAYDGQWGQGLPRIERARQLNRLRPGWYWLPFSIDAYLRKGLVQTLVAASRLKMPDFF